MYNVYMMCYICSAILTLKLKEMYVLLNTQHVTTSITTFST